MRLDGGATAPAHDGEVTGDRRSPGAEADPPTRRPQSYRRVRRGRHRRPLRAAVHLTAPHDDGPHSLHRRRRGHRRRGPVPPRLRQAGHDAPSGLGVAPGDGDRGADRDRARATRVVAGHPHPVRSRRGRRSRPIAVGDLLPVDAPSRRTDDHDPAGSRARRRVLPRPRRRGAQGRRGVRRRPSSRREATRRRRRALERAREGPRLESHHRDVGAADEPPGRPPSPRPHRTRGGDHPATSG